MSISGEMLFHAGVKGMKWGVRKKRDDSSSTSSDRPSSSTVKQVALIGAGVVAVAGAAYLAKKGYDKKSLSSITASSVSAGKKFVNAAGSKPAPKLDKKTAAFLADSSRRIASDNTFFQKQAQTTLRELQGNRMMLQWMKGADPEGYAQLLRTARGVFD